MSDSFTVTTHRSWFGRIGNSIVGVLIGIVLLLACTVGLFWNEGRAVTTARSLAEGAGLVVSVPSMTVDPANAGKLIHTTGIATAEEQPRDPLLDVSAPGLRLSRDVEMFQWQEKSESKTQTKLGGGEETVTTYSYSRGWSSDAEDSSRFKQPSGHQNPPMQIKADSFAVQGARIGAFQLDQRIIGMVSGGDKLPIGADRLDRIRSALATPRPVSLFDNGIYIGADPTRPELGDYRISFTLVPLGELSIVGQQSGDGLEPYQTRAGDRLLLVDTGEVQAAAMFENAATENTVLTWILRLVGLVLLVVAFSLLLAPLGVIGDVIPFVGQLIRMGTGIVALVLATLAGSLIIALAWLWYRPILSLIVLAVGFGIAWLIGRMGRKSAPAQPA